MSAGDESNAPTPDAGAKRKRMSVFYGKDAGGIEEWRMQHEGMTDVTRAGMVKVREQIVPTVSSNKTTLLFSEPGEDGMSLVYLWYKSGFTLPPHSHNCDCLYFVMAGEARMGSHVLRKGDGFFVPRDHSYAYEAGPDGVEVLEFRNATRFNIVHTAQDLAPWERMAAVLRDRATIWQDETIPPSDR